MQLIGRRLRIGKTAHKPQSHIPPMIYELEMRQGTGEAIWPDKCNFL